MEQEKIDLQKLSQKELLIVTYKEVEKLTSCVAKLTDTQGKHEVRISVIESRVMMWGAVFGLLGAGAMQLVISYFN